MEVNRFVCGANIKNTGVGTCSLALQTVAGAFLVPADFVIDEAGAADLFDTLQAAAKASKRNRIYPVHRFVQVTNNSEDKTTQSFGYGGLAVVREGFYNWLLQYVDGGLCLHNRLRSHNGKAKAVLFYDAQGVIFGRSVLLPANPALIEPEPKYGLGGIPLEYFWANPWTPNDGSNVMATAVQFVFKPKYINEELGYIQANFDLEGVKGLGGVVLSEAVAKAANVLTVAANYGCSFEPDGADFFEDFEADLADDALWKVTTSSGLEIAITSVAADAANRAFTITLDALDPNYSATAPLKVSLVSPAEMETAGADALSLYESNVLSIAGTA